MENQKQEHTGAGAGETSSSQTPPASNAQQEQTPAGAAPKAPFDPLGDAAATKATRPVIVNTGDLQTIIPEPTFEAQPISVEPDPLANPGGGNNNNNNNYNNNGGGGGGGADHGSQSSFSDGASWKSGGYDGPRSGGGGGPQRPKERPPIVRPMEDLTPEERTLASDNAAKAIMQIYKLIHKGMNSMLQVSPFKQARMERKGELDLTTPVLPTRAGNLVSIGAYLKEYNEKVNETFQVDPEFEEEVSPPLRRVLAKHGVGISDEAQVVFSFATDFGVKLAGRFIPMWQEGRIQMDHLKDVSKALREGRQPVAQAPVAPVMQHTAPPPVDQQQQQQQQEFHQPFVDQRGAGSYAQNDAIAEFGNRNLANQHAGEGIQRRFGNKKLLKRAGEIAKKNREKAAGGAGSKAKKKK